MYKIKEPITLRNYGFLEDNPVEICLEGYLLENGSTVYFINGSWEDPDGNHYKDILSEGEIVAFEKYSKKTI